jgi:hypothetical protein
MVPLREPVRPPIAFVPSTPPVAYEASTVPLPLPTSPPIRSVPETFPVACERMISESLLACPTSPPASIVVAEVSPEALDAMILSVLCPAVSPTSPPTNF